MMCKPLSRQPFKDAADFGGLCLRFRAKCPGAVTTPVQLGQQTFGMKEFQRHPDGVRDAPSLRLSSLSVIRSPTRTRCPNHLADGIRNGLMLLFAPGIRCLYHAWLLSDIRFKYCCVTKD